ncbi:MAG: HAMP domain-containing sensor histidine kinase [Candidatus Omnitrophica bacterium]|nr:HAMP domain-containing sensor histidine kinase [Candidatus Omnitrophota bacterium]
MTQAEREEFEELKRRNVQLEAELKKVDQLKTDFISVVSHELRTPLSIIKEGISLVSDGIPGKINKEQEEILETANSNIDRLARIIDNLLDIAKIESGKIVLRKELVNICALVERVVSSFKLNLIDKNLELRTNFPKKELIVYADAGRITQVVINLIGNALKFTQKGFIEVNIEEKEGVVEFSVIDSGQGIINDDLLKVFSKFQQFERSTGEGTKGTGLGLSIAKGLIEMHNGKIWAESEHGKGSKFTFSLPKYNSKF